MDNKFYGSFVECIEDKINFYCLGCFGVNDKNPVLSSSIEAAKSVSWLYHKKGTFSCSKCGKGLIFSKHLDGCYKLCRTTTKPQTNKLILKYLNVCGYLTGTKDELEKMYNAQQIKNIRAVKLMKMDACTSYSQAVDQLRNRFIYIDLELFNTYDEVRNEYEAKSSVAIQANLSSNSYHLITGIPHSKTNFSNHYGFFHADLVAPFEESDLFQF